VLSQHLLIYLERCCGAEPWASRQPAANSSAYLLHNCTTQHSSTVHAKQRHALS
jgi:hypothetical protein